MINRKVQITGFGLTVNGVKSYTFVPQMSIRKLALCLYATYTNGGTAVTNSTLLALGMWEVTVKINGVPYHYYTPEMICRVNEARGYIPESTDCNAIGGSTAGTAYATFELPVSIVKTDIIKEIEVEIKHTTTGAGSTNAGTVTNPYMDLTIHYDDQVISTTRFISKTLPSSTAPEDNLGVNGLLDAVFIWGAADYITSMYIEHNGVRVIDLQGWKQYVKERTLRLQGTRKGYGESVDTDNIPVELNTKMVAANSTAQALSVGYLYIAEVDASVVEALTEKPVSNVGQSTVSVVATELTGDARIGGIDVPINYSDHPYGEISQ